jgi:cyclopropane fatty-acyl-phospholipid synthase-like methyltransferase
MLARVKSLPASLMGASMRKRVGAWWRGGRPARGKDDASPGPPQDEPSPTDWLVVAERLWGPSNLGPGEDEFIPRLALGLNLSAEKTMAYFGVGLGGAARRIVDKTDVWIVGYEADADAAACGIEQCRRVGRGRKVAINHVTYDYLNLPKDKFHAVLAKEAFYNVADRGRVFRQIDWALKGGGSLLFTDYIVTRDPLSAEACSALFGKRAAPVSPCSAESYLGLMKAHDFDVRVDEDITDPYVDFVTEGWSNLRALLDHLGMQADNPVRRMHFLRAVAEEAAMWANRLEALRSRKLGVRRFLAIKPAKSAVLR